MGLRESSAYPSTSFLKIYVLRTDSVVVLNPGFPFAVRKTFFLQTAINHGERSAFLTPDGLQLIVAAGDFLHVFDAVDPAEPVFRSLDMGGHITGLTATSDSDRAYVITEGSMEVRTVALKTDPPQVLAGPLGLPEIPKAIGTAPNTSGIYAASDSSVFEIDPHSFEITATIPTELEGSKTLDFDPQPPVPSAFVVAGTSVGFVDLLTAEPGRVFRPGVEITEVIAPGDGSAYGIFGEAGAVVRSNITTGGLATVQDPDTAAPFPLPEVDLEVGVGGESVVIAFGDTGLVVRMDAAGAVMGLVLTTEGLFGTDTGVGITSPDDIFIDTPLAISDEAGKISTGVTLGCSLGPGAITATLLAPAGVMRMIPFLAMTGAPATLTKTRGDLQTGVAGEVLNGAGRGLFAELKDACGNPISSEPIVWEVSPPDGATFANVFPRTNDAGEVFASVRLGSQPGPVALTARTGGLSTTFNLTIVGPATLMREVGGDGQLISIGEAATFPLVVELLGDSADPVEGLAVDFTITEGSGSLTSNQATSNTLGRASVGVIAGALLGPLTVEARAGDLVFVFRLTVVGRTPFVSSVGFVNSGSFLVGFVPGGGGTIFGIGLMEGVDGIVVPDTFPFPLELGGVKVFVNGVQVPIIAIANVNGQEQINIQVPFETPAPADGIEVIVCNNGALATFFVQTFRTQPGLFEIPFAEGLFVAAIDLDFRVVGPNNPVEPGSIFSLFLTSMGPTTPAVGTNVPGGVPPAVTVETPQVLINGQPVQVLGSFYAPGLITGYQINIVASDLPLGIYPIQVIAGGVASKESLVFIEP